MADDTGRPWLLCIHNIPPKPGYLRAKAARRLAALGAVALKNAVYCLPDSKQAREDLAWLAKEIEDGGGKAFVCEAELLAGLTDAQVRAQFLTAADVRYEQIAAAAREALEGLDDEQADADRERATALLTALRKDYAAARSLDFFGAPGRERADGQLAALTGWIARAEQGEIERGGPTAQTLEHFRSRVWVTRSGVHVDRMASAWLILRFVDPEARFRFVEGRDFQPQPGEVRFDMVEAEFTHEGELCTFEVLLARLGLDDPALAAVAQVVHDIDLKEARHGRPETPGVAALLAAIGATESDDARRVERGCRVFDDLLTYYQTTAP